MNQCRPQRYRLSEALESVPPQDFRLQKFVYYDVRERFLELPAQLTVRAISKAMSKPISEIRRLSHTFIRTGRGVRPASAILEGPR